MQKICLLKFLKLIHLSARIHAAKIRRPYKRCGGEIQHNLTRFVDDVMRMATGSDRNVGFWRNGVENSRPRDGQDIRLFPIAAAHHHGRQGGKQCAAPQFDLIHNQHSKKQLFLI